MRPSTHRLGQHDSIRNDGNRSGHTLPRKEQPVVMATFEGNGIERNGTDNNDRADELAKSHSEEDREAKQKTGKIAAAMKETPEERPT